MKKVIMLSILLLFFCVPHAIGGDRTVKEGKGQTAEEAASIRVYEVYGMDCPGCHGGLEKLVKKIPAVESADADWKKKQLTVTVKQGAELNDEDIYNAIERANFTVGERVK